MRFLTRFASRPLVLALQGLDSCNFLDVDQVVDSSIYGRCLGHGRRAGYLHHHGLDRYLEHYRY